MQWTNAKIKKSPGISMDCLEMNQNACMSRVLGIYIYIFFFFFTSVNKTTMNLKEC